jgi:hypothetical protein
MAAIDSPAVGLAVVFLLAFCVFLLIAMRIRRDQAPRDEG